MNNNAAPTPQPPIRVADGEVRPGDTVYLAMEGVPAFTVIERSHEAGWCIIGSGDIKRFSDHEDNLFTSREAAVAARKEDLESAIEAGERAARELAELEAAK